MHDSSERSPGSLILFGIALAGILMSLAGIILARPWLALGGALVILFVTLCFRLGSLDD